MGTQLTFDHAQAAEALPTPIAADATVFDDELEPTEQADTYLDTPPIAERLLPQGIREFCRVAPPSRKVPSILVAIICYCVLATRIRLDYTYDQREHALLLNLIIEGEPSVGKSFACSIVERIIGPSLTEHDDRIRLLEQQYREKKSRRKANEKLEEPPIYVVRSVPPNVSKTVMVKRADMCRRKYGDMLAFWMFSEELAQLVDAGRQAYSSLRTMMRSAWDLGSKYGLDFASDNSYSAIVDINVVSLFLATPYDVDMYMDKASVMGGNCTRNIIYSLKDDVTGEVAEFKKLTPEEEASILSVVHRLMDETYMSEDELKPTLKLDMDFLSREVRKWCKKRQNECKKGSNNAYFVFHKRSSLSAYRATALCYYLYQLEGVGEKAAQARCRRIYHWLASLIHTNLVSRWGAQYDRLKYNRSEESGEGLVRKPLLEMLSPTFTRNQLEVMIKQNFMKTDPRKFISLWKANGWIKQVGYGVYEKME